MFWKSGYLQGKDFNDPQADNFTQWSYCVHNIMSDKIFFYDPLFFTLFFTLNIINVCCWKALSKELRKELGLWQKNHLNEFTYFKKQTVLNFQNGQGT